MSNYQILNGLITKHRVECRFEFDLPALENMSIQDESIIDDADGGGDDGDGDDLPMAEVVLSTNLK